MNNTESPTAITTEIMREVDIIPPSRFYGKPPSHNAKIVTKLKDNPGIWYLVSEHNTLNAAGSRAQCLRRYGADAISRGCAVYARWIQS